MVFRNTAGSAVTGSAAAAVTDGVAIASADGVDAKLARLGASPAQPATIEASVKTTALRVSTFVVPRRLTALGEPLAHPPVPGVYRPCFLASI